MTKDREQVERVGHSGAGQAAKRILEEIISGDLKAGSQLVIRDLVSRTGFGPTPLREGMSRLIASGLVIGVDHKGFKVTPIAASDIADYVEFRLLLEQKALNQSMRIADPGWSAAVKDALARFLDFSFHRRERPTDAIVRYSMLHKKLHSSLVSGCLSTRLKDYLDLLYDQEIFYCHNLVSSDNRLEDLMRLHKGSEHEELAAHALSGAIDHTREGLALHLKTLAADLAARINGKTAHR